MPVFWWMRLDLVFLVVVCLALLLSFLSCLSAFFFCIVFSSCFHRWICFLVWLLSSFFFLNYFLIFNNFFKFFILIILFFSYFIFFFLSFSFSPFSSEPCGWQCLGAPAGCQACASEVGEPSSGHWSTRDLLAPRNIKWWKLSQKFYLKYKIQLYSTTSKLQCWTPDAIQIARQEHNPTH